MKRLIKKVLGKWQCLRFKLKNAGKNVYIGMHCKLVNGNKIILDNDVSIMPYTMLVAHGKDAVLKIGEGSEIGMFSRIAAKNSVIVGSNVITGPNIFIADYNHEYTHAGTPIKKQGITEGGSVEIGKDSWIGTNVVIVGKVKIGKGTVIGANSVVTKDIPDYCVAVGNPCRVIKKYNSEKKEWEKVNK